MTQATGDVKLSPLQIAQLAKAATDQGFDLSPVEEGGWLRCRSTQFPEHVWLSVADDGYQLASDSRRILDELAREGLSVLQAVFRPADAKGAVHLAEYGELYRLLGRVAALAQTAPDRLIEKFVAATQSLPESTEVERLVKQRVGQDIFRNALIAFWQGRCAVTGLAVLPLLRASHIKPWADCESNQERLDVFNGLLLAPHLDALFDGGWITFDDVGRLVKSPLLDDAAVQLLRVNSELKLTYLAAEHYPYLDYHRRNIFQHAAR
jgi:putative restriction endonuclease